jgi:glycosyltransferase involved in cell wall biosynthesis
VAVVLEQCWHRVPGGTARAALEQVEAVQELGQPHSRDQESVGDRGSGDQDDQAEDPDPVDQIGVAAWHRRPPREPWQPTVKVSHLKLPRRAMYDAWHRYRRPPVEWATGPVDVIHATGYAIPPRTRPLVVTLHDLAWRRDPSNFTPRGVRFFEAALRRTSEEADLVLCPSKATLDDCVAAGIEPARLRHIPWGIDADLADDASVEAVRQRYGLSGRYVLFVGTLEPRKNLRRLLDAVRRLPQRDVTLAIAGPVGWGDALGDSAGDMRERVRLLGFVAPEELAPLNRGAAVVCYPSLWEGYGLPVAEALAQGAPVVTSKGTATEELVAGGAGLAVDPHDPDAIAAAIARVLDDDDLVATLWAAARARAAERTWEATARLTVEAYRFVSDVEGTST